MSNVIDLKTRRALKQEQIKQREVKDLELQKDLKALRRADRLQILRELGLGCLALILMAAVFALILL